MVIAPNWSVAFRRRLDVILSQFGEAYFVSRYPQFVAVIEHGERHLHARECSGSLAVLIGPKSDHVWKPRLAEEMIRETLEAMPQPRKDTPGRRKLFKLMDAIEDAERRQDMTAVRTLIRDAESVRGELEKEARTQVQKKARTQKGKVQHERPPRAKRRV